MTSQPSRSRPQAHRPGRRRARAAARLLLIGLVAAAAAGCQLRLDVGAQVAADGSGSLTLVQAFDDELADRLDDGGHDPFAAMVASLPDDWQLDDYDDGTFTGKQATVTFDTPAELNQHVSNLTDGTRSLFDTFELSRDGATFTFDATVAPLDLDELLDVTFTLDLPGDVASHDADTVDGEALVWQLSVDGAQLHATSDTGATPAWHVAAAIAAAALLVGAAAAFVRPARHS